MLCLAHTLYSAPTVPSLTQATTAASIVGGERHPHAVCAHAWQWNGRVARAQKKDDRKGKKAAEANPHEARRLHGMFAAAARAGASGSVIPKLPKKDTANSDKCVRAAQGLFADVSDVSSSFNRVVSLGKLAAFPVAAANKLCWCVEKSVASPPKLV